MVAELDSRILAVRMTCGRPARGPFGPVIGPLGTLALGA